MSASVIFSTSFSTERTCHSVSCFQNIIVFSLQVFELQAFKVRCYFCVNYLVFLIVIIIIALGNRNQLMAHCAACSLAILFLAVKEVHWVIFHGKWIVWTTRTIYDCFIRGAFISGSNKHKQFSLSRLQFSFKWALNNITLASGAFQRNMFFEVFKDEVYEILGAFLGFANKVGLLAHNGCCLIINAYPVLTTYAVYFSLTTS